MDMCSFVFKYIKLNDKYYQKEQFLLWENNNSNKGGFLAEKSFFSEILI